MSTIIVLSLNTNVYADPSDDPWINSKWKGKCNSFLVNNIVTSCNNTISVKSSNDSNNFAIFSKYKGISFEFISHMSDYDTPQNEKDVTVYSIDGVDMIKIDSHDYSKAKGSCTKSIRFDRKFNKNYFDFRCDVLSVNLVRVIYSFTSDLYVESNSE